MAFSPPVLIEEFIEFDSIPQLDWFAQSELRHGRLTVLTRIGITLFENLSIGVRISGQVIGRLTVCPVSKTADIVGLQILESTLPAVGTSTPDSDARRGGDRKADLSPERVSGKLSEAPPRVSSGSDFGTPTQRLNPEVVENRMPSQSPSRTESSVELLGGLLDDDVGESGSAPLVDQQPSRIQQTAQRRDGPQEDDRMCEGEFRVFDPFSPLDKESLIGFLFFVQINCEPGGLTLRTPSGIVQFWTDRRGQIVFEQSQIPLLEKMSASNADRVSKNTTLQTRNVDLIVNSLAHFSRESRVSFRYEKNSVAKGKLHAVPMSVYCSSVLLDLLKTSRLDVYKDFYQSRWSHFVSLALSAPMSADRYALGRKASRFFDLLDSQEYAISNLLKVSPASQGETLRFIRLGELLGLLHLKRERTTVVDESESHLRNLRAQHTRSLENHFEALGTHMVAHPSTYKDSLALMKERFGKDSSLVSHSNRHAQLSLQIIGLAVEAFEFLQVRQRRVEYRKQKFGQSLLSQAAQVLLEKADMSRLREDHDKMKQSLEMAIELDSVLTKQHLKQHKAADYEDLDHSSVDS